MTTRRQERIAQLLHDELTVIVTELSDPRLDDALVAVTSVTVSPDLRDARVYVEHQLGHEANRQVLDALAHAEPFMRRNLVERLDLRFVPHLNFHVDETSLRARRIDELLDQLHPTQEQQGHDDANAAA